MRLRFGSRPDAQKAAWAGLAVLLGLWVARLPVVVAGGGLALAALGVLVIVEPALAVVLMLGVAPLKTLIATEAPVALPADIGQVSFALVVFAWMVWRVRARRHVPLPRTRVLVPVIGIMIAFSPSLFAAASTGAWLSEFLKWIEIALLLLIVYDLGDGRWQWVAGGVVVAATLQALIGLYEFQGGSGAPHLWIAEYQHFRAFGTFGQPNPFSAFMGLSLPLALGLAWGHGTRVWRLRRERDGTSRAAWWESGILAAAYGAAGLLLFAGLIASWGRGAWLGFGAAGVVMVCFAPRRRWQGMALVAAGGALIGSLWLAGYVPLSIQQRVDSAMTEFIGFRDVRGVPISDENFAIVERLAHWQAAYAMANAHPFIGVGLGNYEVVYPDYGVPSWPRALGHAHNDYLNVLAETGVVGLTGYLAAWGVLVYWTLRALRQPDPVMRGLVLGLLGTWTHLAVHSFVDKLYVNNLFLHIGAMIGLLAVAHHRYQSATVEREHGIL